MSTARSNTNRFALWFVLGSLLLVACDAGQPPSTPPMQAAITPAITLVSNPPLPALEIINRAEQAYYISLPLSGVSSAVLTMTSSTAPGTPSAGKTRYVTFYQTPGQWREESGDRVTIQDSSGIYTINGGANRGGSMLMLLFGTGFVGLGNCYKPNQVAVEGTGEMFGQPAWVLRAPAAEECRERQGIGDALIWIDQRTFIDLRVQVQATKDGVVGTDDLYTTQVEYDVPLDPTLFAKTTATSTIASTLLPTAVTEPPATSPLGNATANPTAVRSPEQLLYQASTLFRWDGYTRRGVNASITTLVMTTTIKNVTLPKGYGQIGTVRQRVWYQAPNQWRSETEADGKTSVVISYASREGEPAPYSRSNLASPVVLPSESTCYNPPVVQRGETMLGRTTWLLEMVSTGQCQVKDAYHPADRLTFWVDQATLIPLKAEWGNKDGTIVYQGQVEGIDLDVPLDPTIFKAR